jgi:hypothetical protein
MMVSDLELSQPNMEISCTDICSILYYLRASVGRTWQNEEAGK